MSSIFIFPFNTSHRGQVQPPSLMVSHAQGTIFNHLSKVAFHPAISSLSLPASSARQFQTLMWIRVYLGKQGHPGITQVPSSSIGTWPQNGQFFNSLISFYFGAAFSAANRIQPNLAPMVLVIFWQVAHGRRLH